MRSGIQNLVLVMLVVVTTVEYLTEGDRWGNGAILPDRSPYLIELLAAFAALVVVLVGIRTRYQYVRPGYWFIFGGIVIVAICGVVVNAVEPGPIFAGIRNYVRAIPWFFIPAVYAFSDKEVRQQLRLLLLICIIQVPIAIHQRINTAAADRYTGDWTTGTLVISSILSIFLICALCVLTALYIKKKLSMKQFVLLFFLLLLPTTINETKGTLLLLPLGLLMTFFLATPPRKRFHSAVVATGLLSLALSIFIPIYDYVNSGREYATPLTEFFTNESRLQGYIWTNADVGSDKAGGRGDAIVVPVRYLSKEIGNLAFGLGLGNVSKSALGEAYTGEYFKLFEPFVFTSFARLLLELGFLGILLVSALYWMIFTDARFVAKHDNGIKGALSAGWLGVVPVMFAAIFYKDVIAQASLSNLFWYFSGLIAAERMRMTLRPPAIQSQS